MQICDFRNSELTAVCPTSNDQFEVSDLPFSYHLQQPIKIALEILGR